ncbi:MAG: hypothetical protein QW117_02350 [Candidatus Pacearchaeota archaeon]
MRIKRGFFICASLIFIFSIFCNLNFVLGAAFNITGYTYGIEGNWKAALNATNITIEIYQKNMNGPHYLNTTLSTLSNESGYFNIEIPEDYSNDNFFYKIILIKYNENNSDLARFIGPNLPYFPSDQLSNLGTVYFYLRPAITIDISAIGIEHVTDDENRIKYNDINTFPEDYKTGLEIINNSGEKQYAYINNSDCLIVLNESFDLNSSFCDLNITNIDDFTLGLEEEIYFINLTEIQKCFFDLSTGSADCNKEQGNSTDISELNLSKTGGISFNKFINGDEKLFISALNESGNSYVYVYNYSDLSFIKSISTPDCPIGKLIFQPGGGFGIGNNSGRYVFYKFILNEQEGFSCSSNLLNLTEGMIVKGFDTEADFGNEYYIVSNQSGTTNLTQINFFTSDYNFRYQFKDKKLGYSIKESFDSLKYSDRIYIPADRNYSFMIYPEGGPAFPVSIELNNLVHNSKISLGTAENRTITSINQSLYLNLTNLNLTTQLVKLSGYSKLNGSDEKNFTDYTIVAYLIESNNIVFSQAMLPQNIGQFSENGFEDVFNKTNGFYNMTLPSAVYGANILLFANAKKDNVWYGGFKIITLNYGETPDELNITLYPLVGKESILERTMGAGDDVNVSLFTFNITSLLENGNKTDVTNVHSEISIDYSHFSGSNVSFSWMVDSGNENLLKVPLLNNSVNIKIFSPQFPPIKRTIKIENLQNDTYEITLEQLKAKKPNGEEIQNVQFRNFKYKEDSSCSVPWPNEQPGEQGCLPDGIGSGGGPVNPFTWVISGGKYDLEIRQNTTNITIHYVNVDLLASQPPDAMFEENANKTTSGNIMKEAWRFGSAGPNIYDYVIIGVPYNDSAINESSEIKINITKFHDEDWNALWEQGDSLDNLNGTEYEDYKSSDYIKYINGSAVFCNETDENLTSGLCYKDLIHNMIWFKIPHFSGIEPSIVGQAIITESEEEENENDGGTSNSGTNTGIITYYTTESSFLEGIIYNLSYNDKIRFYLANENHTLTLLTFNTTTAKIKIESNTIITYIEKNVIYEFDLNNDSIKDIKVKYEGMALGKAKIFIQKIIQPISTERSSPEETKNETTSVGTENKDIEKSKKEKISKEKMILISIIILVVILFFIFYYFYKKRRYYNKGY